ncbi:Teneurin-a [Nymphon striatum]|nr:Teneurin-a [Nymphon striatum]
MFEVVGTSSEKSSPRAPCYEFYLSFSLMEEEYLRIDVEESSVNILNLYASFAKKLSKETISLACENDCNGHGKCQNGECNCFAGYTGLLCEENTCPVLCSNHGRYSEGICHCDEGWKGQDCSLQSYQCEVADCNRKGRCQSGKCICMTGYKGTFCEIEDCEDPNCSTHGSCVDAMCHCKAGWKGKTCNQVDNKITQCLPNCTDHGVYDHSVIWIVAKDSAKMAYAFVTMVGAVKDVSTDHVTLDVLNTVNVTMELVFVFKAGVASTVHLNPTTQFLSLSANKAANYEADFRAVSTKGHVQSSDDADIDIAKAAVASSQADKTKGHSYGCPNGCSNHGDCMKKDEMDDDSWFCQCRWGWGGPDCGTLLETDCQDQKDNDGVRDASAGSSVVFTCVHLALLNDVLMDHTAVVMQSGSGVNTPPVYSVKSLASLPASIRTMKTLWYWNLRSIRFIGHCLKFCRMYFKAMSVIFIPFGEYARQSKAALLRKYSICLNAMVSMLDYAWFSWYIDVNMEGSGNHST